MDYSYLNQAGFDPAMSAAVAVADNSFYGDLVITFCYLPNLTFSNG